MRYREPYLALTVKQPWASLLVHGVKDVENRAWIPAGGPYPLPVWIHAARIPDPNPGDLALEAVFRLRIPTPPGCFVGGVLVTDIVKRHPSPWAQPGAFQWCMDPNPEPLPAPIPYPGQRGLWRVSLALHQQMINQIYQNDEVKR